MSEQSSACLRQNFLPPIIHVLCLFPIGSCEQSLFGLFKCWIKLWDHLKRLCASAAKRTACLAYIHVLAVAIVCVCVRVDACPVAHFITNMHAITLCRETYVLLLDSFVCHFQWELSVILFSNVFSCIANSLPHVISCFKCYYCYRCCFRSSLHWVIIVSQTTCCQCGVAVHQL